MSFRIAQDYFENNLSDPDSQFQRNGDYFERTVGEDDLTFSLSESADGKNFVLNFSNNGIILLILTMNGFNYFRLAFYIKIFC